MFDQADIDNQTEELTEKPDDRALFPRSISHQFHSRCLPFSADSKCPPQYVIEDTEILDRVLCWAKDDLIKQLESEGGKKREKRSASEPPSTLTYLYDEGIKPTDSADGVLTCPM